MFLLTSILLLFLCVKAALLTTNDVENLYDFYIETNGVNWKLFDPSRAWNFTSPNTTGTEPCSHEDENGDIVFGWEGVGCSYFCIFENSCNLTGLSLAGIGMTGHFPDSVGNFKHLLNLDLKQNELSGSLPSLLSEASLLEVLIVDNNQLSGAIPNSLMCSSILNSLSLNSNFLSSTLPSCTEGFLGKITSLVLYNNGLSGAI